MGLGKGFGGVEGEGYVETDQPWGTKQLLR